MEISCGLLMYVRAADSAATVLLGHPGGPYWRKKDLGAWSIPKGMAEPGEDLLDAAKREFTEEVGLVCRRPFHALKPLKQKSGKLIHCWAFEGDPNQGTDSPLDFSGSTFEIEWPPRSGKRASFTEIDDARLFAVDEALQKIIPGQAAFVRELVDLLG